MRKTLISQMQHICNQQGKNEYLTQNGKFWPKKKGSRYFFWIVGLESWGGRVCVLYILVRTILYLLKRRNLHLQQTITYGYSSNMCVFCVRLGSQTVGSFVISQFHKNKQTATSSVVSTLQQFCSSLPIKDNLQKCLKETGCSLAHR